MMIRQQQQLDHSSRVFYRLSSLVLNLLRLLGISMALMLCGSVTFFIGFFFMPWVLGLAMVFYIAGVVSSLVVSRLSYLGKLILCYASPRKVAAMDVLSDDELGLILKQVDRRCVSQVCKRWRRWEALNRSSIFVRTPGILNQLLPRFPNLLKFRTGQGMSNADLDFLSQTCPKLEVIEFNEPVKSTNYNVLVGEKGLCALANKCSKLTKIVFRERMNISEVGILPFITNSALHLTHLEIRNCDWVTDQSLQAIGSSSFSKTIKKLVLKRCYKISDSGVSCLKNLCLLEELDLKYCSQITDTALEFLVNGSITQIMKKLDISHCNKITDVGVSHMQKMCVLEDLNLKGCVKITNRALEFLANGSLSKTLKKLNLTRCYCIYGSGVSNLKNMCVLEELNFPEGGYRITDRGLEFLANGSWSKTMKKLHLSSTDITDVVVSHLSDMCVLNELNLRRCQRITDRALEYLANGSVPRTMKKLDISDCHQITDVGVSHMQKMCVLEELNLDGCGTITDRALEFLANGFPLKTLKKLDISDCNKITDVGVSTMQKMCVLEELNWRSCVEITNRALEFLANGFPSNTLKKLDLWGTNITDVGVSHLRDICVLEELNLTHCSITDGGLKFLANGFPSKTLKKLVLYNNTNITDAGLQFLQNMCVLEEPYLGNCSLITDYGLEYLANGSPSKTLKFLNFLEIWGTYITNVGVSHLLKMLVMVTQGRP